MAQGQAALGSRSEARSKRKGGVEREGGDEGEREGAEHASPEKQAGGRQERGHVARAAGAGDEGEREGAEPAGGADGHVVRAQAPLSDEHGQLERLKR